MLLRTAARDWGATPAERDALEGLTRAAWASSTLTQYEMHMNAFVRWCEKEKVCSVPAEPASVARYLAALKMADKIHGDSVRSVVAAIRAMHSSVGLPSPTDDVMVRLIITGFQKAAVKKTAVAGRTRVPFMATRVVPLLRWFTALKTKEEWQWEVMGLLLFQYFFWARASTVAAVTAQDVQVRHDGIVFMERFAKGRGAARAAKPRRLVIPYRPTYQKMALQLQLDPIKVLATFILRQQARPGAELSLFWCKAVPRELASGLISREYQRLCDEAKIDLGLQEGQFLSSHSPRSGGVSDAIQLGVALGTAASWGDWGSISAMRPYMTPVASVPEVILFFGHLLPQADRVLISEHQATTE